MNKEEINALVQEKQAIIKKIRNNMSEIIVGQEKLIDRLLVALFTRSHILLESVPGLAKTTAISTLAKTVGLDFKRIQFTPDLLPSDLIGSRVFNMQNNSFSVKKGPIFANLILADEINRSPAKVQSALLEAMQERQVTIGDETFKLDNPFLVMATENPIEQEGTYSLPEAQVDRFLLKTVIDYPTKGEEMRIINEAESRDAKMNNLSEVVSQEEILSLIKIVEDVYIDESVKQYIIDLVFTSRTPGDIKADGIELGKMIAYGASPRASIGLMRAAKAVAMLNGRGFVIPDDVKEIALDVLRHRIAPTYEAEAENVSSDDLVKIILNNVLVP